MHWKEAKHNKEEIHGKTKFCILFVILFKLVGIVFALFLYNQFKWKEIRLPNGKQRMTFLALLNFSIHSLACMYVGLMHNCIAEFYKHI